jgi:hypothetical protein
MLAKQIFVSLFLIGLLAGLCTAQTNRRSAAPKSQRIKIYFYHEPGEYIDLSPVTRVIRSNSPAWAAIEGLLAGPTAAERQKGFEGLSGAGEFAIGKLTIKGGTARINFVSSRTWAGFPGDIAPARFKKAVELTLKQFGNVKRVIVSLDGDLNFET